MFPYPPSETVRVNLALAIEQLSRGGLSEARRDLALGVVEGIMAGDEGPAALLDLIILCAVMVRDSEPAYELMLQALQLDGDSLLRAGTATDYPRKENEP